MENGSLMLDFVNQKITEREFCVEYMSRISQQSYEHTDRRQGQPPPSCLQFYGVKASRRQLPSALHALL